MSPSSNRACGFPAHYVIAHGFPMFFMPRHPLFSSRLSLAVCISRNACGARHLGAARMRNLGLSTGGASASRYAVVRPRGT